MRSSAALTRLIALSNTAKLPQCITALMLSTIAGVDQTQRISVLAAAASHVSNLSENYTNDEFPSSVIYKQVAYVLKQCERSPSLSTNVSTSIVAGCANTTSRGPRNQSPVKRPSSASALKRLPCHTCGKYGNWK